MHEEEKLAYVIRPRVTCNRGDKIVTTCKEESWMDHFERAVFDPAVGLEIEKRIMDA